MSLFKIILKSRWVRITLTLTLIQQALVAMGTFLMGKVASDVSSQGLHFAPLIALFLCLIFPGSLVHYLMAWTTARANKSILLNYFKNYFTANYNHPSHWRHEESRKKRHDVMTRTGQDTLTSTLDFMIDFSATGLNIILNTLSVILVTNQAIGASIVIAGILGLWLIHLADQSIASASKNEMLAENRLNAHLNRSWDNIILGNLFFFQHWVNRFEKLFADTKSAAFSTVWKRDRIVSIAGFLTTLIVVATSLTLAWIHRLNTPLVVAILIMLPRSLQIVLHLQIIQSYWARWKSLREKLILTEESFSPFDKVNLSAYIQRERIFGDVNFESLNLTKTGRFTLGGSNGSGKSTFLLQLKEKLGERAIYLPAQHQLELTEAGAALSSGQTALSCLNDALRSRAEVLLLDEWDANLSPENRKLQDQVIDSLSLERVVVEVRHLRT